jgi:hypothetical protein
MQSNEAYPNSGLPHAMLGAHDLAGGLLAGFLQITGNLQGGGYRHLSEAGFAMQRVHARGRNYGRNKARPLCLAPGRKSSHPISPLSQMRKDVKV